LKALRVEGLTTSFRTERVWSPVVRDVNLELDRGETLAIVGESGSGKSVTAYSIMRLLPSARTRIEGRVWLEETDLLALSPPEMEAVRGNRIAMIFQEPMTSLNPVLTVGRQIEEAILRHRDVARPAARREAARMLDRVRMPSAKALLGQHPHELSGGMLQRVMIAMALAPRPEILIADEPTTALDVTVQAQILALLRELQAEDDLGVLFITHDMGVVAETADRVAVMHRARVVETGGAEAIFRRPTTAYTRALLAAVPRLGALRGTTAPVAFDETDIDTGEIHVGREVARRPPAGGEARTLLAIDGLVTRFSSRRNLFGRTLERVHAVQDVSFSIGEGETLSIVGESGCGKSTVARSVLRLVDPESGSVRLDGEEVLKMDRDALVHARRQMPMVFQDPLSSLNPRMRVGEALTEPMLIHGLADRSEAGDQAADLMRRVGLSPDMLDRFPHEFSGGQRQRICIARALGLGPRLLIADEAVSALDVRIKAQVANLLLELQEAFGLAMLFISHDMAVVERVSHRVAVMYLGEIVEIGPRRSVIDSPAHDYTRRLLAAVPVPEPGMRRERRSPGRAEEVPSPVHRADYVPRRRRYRQIEPGHLVMEPR